MSDIESAIINNVSSDDNKQIARRSRGRKGKAPSKSETVAKGLGPEVVAVGDIEGKRRTRSATKGVPATPPPPTKKERKSSNSSAIKPKGRGRPRKNVGIEANKSKDEKTSSVEEDKDEEMEVVSGARNDVNARENDKQATGSDKDEDDGIGGGGGGGDDDDDDDDDDNNDDDNEEDDNNETAKQVVAATKTTTTTTTVTTDSEVVADGQKTKNVQENGGKASVAGKTTHAAGSDGEDADADAEAVLEDIGDRTREKDRGGSKLSSEEEEEEDDDDKTATEASKMALEITKVKQADPPSNSATDNTTSE